jgi:hypothetical protein
MERLFKTAIALVFMSGLQLSNAFSSISIPSTVNANQTVMVTVANDLSSSGSSSFDRQFTTYRLYLAIIAPSSSKIPNSPEPSCYLVNATSISTTSLAVVIPPTVGPDGTSYHIVTMEYSTRPHAAPPTGYEFSSIFTLYNTTSSWSAPDLHGDFPLFPDLLPCHAYDCARRCLADAYPANLNSSSFASTYACTAACPGVDYPSWKDIQAQGAAEGDPLAGAGNEGAPTILPAYASLLTTVPVQPTAVRTANASANATTKAPVASATGKSEGVVAAWGGTAVVLGVVAHLVAAVL